MDEFAVRIRGMSKDQISQVEELLFLSDPTGEWGKYFKREYTPSKFRAFFVFEAGVHSRYVYWVTNHSTPRGAPILPVEEARTIIKRALALQDLVEN